MEASGFWCIIERKREMLELNVLCGTFPLDPFWGGAGRQELGLCHCWGSSEEIFSGFRKIKRQGILDKTFQMHENTSPCLIRNW